MEKEWEDFWVTGTVGDYLSYKNHYQVESTQNESDKRGQRVHGTDNHGDRDGDKHHAHIGL